MRRGSEFMEYSKKDALDEVLRYANMIANYKIKDEADFERLRKTLSTALSNYYLAVEKKKKLR